MCKHSSINLLEQGFSNSDIHFEIYLNLRYDGTDTSIMTLRPEDQDYEKAFVTQYKREYGFVIEVRILTFFSRFSQLFLRVVQLLLMISEFGPKLLQAKFRFIKFQSQQRK